MPVTSYTASNGQPGELIDAPTLLANIQSGTTGSVITDSLTSPLPTPPTNEGNAFESSSAAVLIDVRSGFSVLAVGWWMVYIDLRATNPIATDSLSMVFNNGNTPIRQTSEIYTLQIAPSTIPSGSYATYQGLFPIYDLTGTLVQLTGTIANGLYVARIRLEEQPAAPHLLTCRPNQLLYSTTDTGYLNVAVSNMTGSTQTATFIVTLNSEYNTTAVVYNATASISSPSGAATSAIVNIPLPALAESGYSVSVNMQYTNGSISVNETITDYFYVSNYPARFGQQGSIQVSGTEQVYTQNGYTGIDTLRNYYFNLSEIDFWAPDDTYSQGLPLSVSSSPAPNAWQWWSGQDLNRVCVGEIADLVQYAHAYGIKVLSYANLRYNFSGPYAKEFFRQYPQWCNWDDTSGSQQISVAGQDEQAAMSDRGGPSPRYPITGGGPTFGESGIWSNNTGDPALIAWHVAQIQQAMLIYGFDGVRYDDTYIYDYPTVNMQGYILPYPGFNNTQVLAAIRGGIHSVNPYSLYGHNMEMWQDDPPATVAMPYTNTLFTGDYYSELMYCDSMHLQERWIDSVGGVAWSVVQSNIFLIGTNAARAGGHAYFIVKITPAVDLSIITAMLFASNGHMNGNTVSTLFNYYQLAVRYSRLFWGTNIVNLQVAGTNPLVLTSSNNIWWQDYVYSVTISGNTLYYVHIINQPTDTDTSGTGSTLQPPATCSLTWTLPVGVTVNSASTITADGSTIPQRVFTVSLTNPSDFTNEITDTLGINSTVAAAAYVQSGTSVTMTVSNVILWTVVVLDCS